MSNYDFEVTDAERIYVNKLNSIYEKLFTDLRKKGHVKEVLHPDQVSIFLKIGKLMDNFSRAYNAMNDLFKPLSRSQSFARTVQQFGISEDTIAYIWYNLCVSQFVNQTELLKTCMLMVLLTEKPPQNKRRGNKTLYDDETLGSLLNKLAYISKYGDQLRNEIDNKLRNAIVHGRYWIVGKFMYYSDDASMSDVQRIRLAALIIHKVKTHNIICQSFIHFHPEWFRRNIKAL